MRTPNRPNRWFDASAQVLRRCLVGILAATGVLSVGAAPPPGRLSIDHPALQNAKALQERITAEVMTWPDVLGTAVGLSDTDEPALIVFIDRDGGSVADVVRAFPPRLLGTAVQLELTDRFRTRAGRPGGGGGGGGVDTKSRQTPPISLGTSGGWEYDLANGYCCGGTLGALVNIGGRLHVLSNYHVLEADIAAGGNQRVATDGDPVIQPGLIDVRCDETLSQEVATLVKKYSLPNNNVDVGVGEIINGMVKTTGEILGIGRLSSQIVSAPAINLGVKKSARTTGLTRSRITAINATVSVSYEDECAGGTAFTKVFTGQLVMSNKGRSFLQGGDSGAVAVEDLADRPRAVGLLFAGSSTSAIANPIADVLSFLGGATMVGD